jgi:serine/threonine protein kinase
LPLGCVEGILHLRMVKASEPARTPRPDDRVADRYLVLEEIGQGGMGRVLAARNEATGKRVALKHLLDPDPTAAARFEREARAAGRIHHPNVVDVYDVIHDHGVMFLVMELLRGEPLSSVLKREGRLEIAEAVAVAAQVSRGVAAAHAEGVIHRDLKPANLFLCQRGSATHAKILDFGISKLVEPEGGHASTRSDIVLGTPHFLSPEQVRGGPVDTRADLYAIGAILYMMLTGRPPHDHAHVPALLVEIATSAPTPVDRLRPETPARLAQLVHRALAKDPEARWQTAASLVEALEEALDATAEDAARAPSAIDEPTRPVPSSKVATTPAPDTPAPAGTLASAAESPSVLPSSTSWRRHATWVAAGGLAAGGLAAVSLWLARAEATPARLDPSAEDAALTRSESSSSGPEAATTLTSSRVGASPETSDGTAPETDPRTSGPPVPDAPPVPTPATETPTGELVDARAASAGGRSRRRPTAPTGTVPEAASTSTDSTSTDSTSTGATTQEAGATVRSAHRAGELHLDDF